MEIQPLYKNHMFIKTVILLLASSLAGILSRMLAFNSQQSLAIAIFSASVIGTLLFWNLRLSIGFLGASLLLITRTIDLDHFIKFASFEVILFLVGMMILMAFLKDMGFFTWILTLILRIKNFTATKFLILISIISALFSCTVDEVTSIIIMVAAIFEICDFFEVNPTPFVIGSVLTTNIGSTGTVLGNPVGILIAAKSGLTFEDFLIKAFPLMLVCLTAVILLLIIWFRRPLEEMDEKIKEHGTNEMFIRLISVPPDAPVKKGLWFFIVTLFLIGMHHRLEVLFDLPPNILLFTIPIISSAIIMLLRFEKAQQYVQKDVEWGTLLFFIFLFAKAGTLRYTGASDVLAQKFSSLAGNNSYVLTSILLWVSSITSSILDNVIVVASFVPIVQSFQSLGFVFQKFWWALLFGACFGGNITLVGSTANIVALGILEKERNIKITFLNWFWVGLSAGVITTGIAWCYLLFFK